MSLRNEIKFLYDGDMYIILHENEVKWIEGTWTSVFGFIEFAFKNRPDLIDLVDISIPFEKVIDDRLREWIEILKACFKEFD
jgi:hypothetical protein